jgi:hypothetical protein
MTELEEVRVYIRENFSQRDILDIDNLKELHIGGGLATRGETSNDIDLIAEINEGILDFPNYGEEIVKIIRHLEESFPDDIKFEDNILDVDIQFFVLSGDNGISQYGKVHEDGTVSKSVDKREITNKEIGFVRLF